MDVAVLLGANPAAAEKEMTEVLLFEIAIANISLPRYTQEQYVVDYYDNKDLTLTLPLYGQYTCPSAHAICLTSHYTANEGPVRIQYKCLVPIYVFPEIKLLFPKQNYNMLPPSSFTHTVSVRDLYISRIALPILQQGNMWTNPGNV